MTDDSGQSGDAQIPADARSVSIYSAEEIASLRRQLVEGNRQARSAALKRGVSVHPRVATLKASKRTS